MAARTPTTAGEPQQTIHVLTTTFEGTRAALTAAVPLAKGCGARLVVIVTQVVPYAITLDNPIDSAEFTIRRCRDFVSELDGEARIQLCLCRRLDDVVSQLLPAHSTIVLGGWVAAWRPTAEAKLMRRMTESGHRVIFVPIKRGAVRDQSGVDDGVSDRVHAAVGIRPDAG